MRPWTMTTEAGGGVDIQDGTYLVEVTKIEETVFEDSQFKKGPQKSAKFTFDLPEVMGDDGTPVVLTANASAERLSPKTKLWGWVEALTGEALEPGQTVNLDLLIGSQAFALVNNEAGQDGVKWARVKTLMPLPKAGKGKAVSSPPVDPWQGYRLPDGDVHWNLVAADTKKEGLTPADLAAFMGTDKAGPKQIREWMEAGDNRTFTQLLLEAQAQKQGQADPEELPFE